MKSSLRFIVFGLLGLFALAACMPPDEPVQDSAVEVERIGESESLLTEATALYPGSDLSLVANTGRPQFLNAYASW